MSLRYVLAGILIKINELVQDNQNFNDKIKINGISLNNIEFANENDVEYNDDIKTALEWCWGCIPFSDSWMPGALQGGFRISYESGSSILPSGLGDVFNWLFRQTTTKSDNMENYLVTAALQILNLKDTKARYKTIRQGLNKVLLKLNTEERMKSEDRMK